MKRTTSISESTLNNSTALTRFTLVALGISLLFFVLLEWTIVKEIWVGTMILPFFYAAGMFSTGFYFGRRSGEKEETPITTGVSYHVATFIIVSTINFFFIFFRHPDIMLETLFGIGFWGFFVLLHLLMDHLMRRYSKRERPSV
ncbi:MAG: hypothetical protein AB7H80_13570 [Candidatus Kapaibacterium sp.]